MASSIKALLSTLEGRLDSHDEDVQEEPLCLLPPRHHCSAGWHWREDGGAGTVYARCPRDRARCCEAAAAIIPGEDTFETFEAAREPDAYQAAQRWVEDCRRGTGKLALLRAEHGELGAGCGKTHLLRAAARELRRCGRRVEMLSSWDLTAAVRGRALYDAGDRAAAEIAIRRWIVCDVLIFDDLGLEETAATVTTGFLAGLLRERENESLGLASPMTEAELKSRYGATLVSRLLGGAQIPALRGRDFRRQRRMKEPA